MPVPHRKSMYPVWLSTKKFGDTTYTSYRVQDYVYIYSAFRGRKGRLLLRVMHIKSWGRWLNAMAKTPSVDFFASSAHIEPASGGGGPVDDAVWSKDYPYIHAYLVTPRDGCGGKGLRGSLTVFPGDAAWVASLHDRAMCANLYRTGETIGDCLEALEMALHEPKPGWKVDREKKRR